MKYEIMKMNWYLTYLFIFFPSALFADFLKKIILCISDVICRLGRNLSQIDIKKNIVLKDVLYGQMIMRNMYQTLISIFKRNYVI